MRVKRWAPAIASLANAAAGFTACAFAVTGAVELGALMVLIAVLLDSLDGALARSLQADSEFGAELDSLADAVSFGVAPALLVGSLLSPSVSRIGWALICTYPLCVVWRLARFNTRHASGAGGHGVFYGLPSTGAGAALVTAVLVYTRIEPLSHVGTFSLTALVVLLGSLTVSRITYRHAGVMVSRLAPMTAALLAVLFIAGSVMWEYEYMFGVLTWAYALSGPLAAATEKIRAVRHA